MFKESTLIKLVDYNTMIKESYQIFYTTTLCHGAITLYPNDPCATRPLISPQKTALWRECNDLVTSGIRANRLDSDVSPSTLMESDRQRGQSMTRISQVWMEENVTDKNPTLDKWWESPGLINSGVPHPIRSVFWGGSNDLTISGVRATSLGDTNGFKWDWYQ